MDIFKKRFQIFQRNDVPGIFIDLLVHIYDKITMFLCKIKLCPIM